MTPIRLRLLWHPQAQFAGYLLAQHAGPAARRGIALDCVPLDFSLGGVEAVLQGESQFAVTSPSHLLESRAPESLSFLLTIQQESPLVYPARRTDGIETLDDLAGRRIAVWPGGEDLEIRWLLHKARVDTRAIDRLPVPDTVEAFVRGEVACAQMTCYHEAHELEHRLAAQGQGSESLIWFRAADRDASLLKDGLVARKDWIAAHPDIVQAIVDSLLEGWSLAFDDPAAAVALCARLRPDMTAEQQARQLADIRALALQKATLSEGLGFPDPRHIERALAALSDVEGHAPALRSGDVVDLRFWKAAPAAMKRSSW